MPRLVKGPDGVMHSFPDKATDAQISAALKAIPQPNAGKVTKAKTWSEQMGLDAPTDSPMVGFARGAASGLVDMAQGAVSNIAGQLNESIDTDNAARKQFGMTETATLPRVERPDNVSGFVGSALPVVAEMAVPGRTAVKAAAEVIPTTAKAGVKFERVMGAARNVPLDVKEVGDASLRIMQLAERGGSMPMAVRKLLVRMTDPEKAPIVYEEARDFASNISRLSADEMGRLTPVMRREVADLAAKLNRANAMAAKQVGKLDDYQSAMREYSNAMRLRSVADASIKAAKKAVPLATAGGTAYWLTNKIRNAVGGE